MTTEILVHILTAYFRHNNIKIYTNMTVENLYNLPKNLTAYTIFNQRFLNLYKLYSVFNLVIVYNKKIYLSIVFINFFHKKLIFFLLFCVK